MIEGLDSGGLWVFLWLVNGGRRDELGALVMCGDRVVDFGGIRWKMVVLLGMTRGITWHSCWL